MEPRVDIDYSGFMRALSGFVAAMEDPKQIMDRGLSTIVGKARPPRDTGRLAGSETVTVSGGVGEVAWTAPYARFVHDGTRHMSAQPWASQAVQQAEQQVIAVIEDGMAETAGRHGLT